MDLDKDGYLTDHLTWSEQTAQQLADLDNVQLSQAHWEIIYVLRRFYDETQTSPAMRPFVKVVAGQLGPDKGNSINLMKLFGESPAKTAAKWSGLPRPTNCL